MSASKINSIDLGPIWLQSGIGIPDHYGVKSTLYFDLDTANPYINKDGLTTWASLTSSGSTTGNTDIYVSAMTFNNANYNLTLRRNDGINFTQNLGILATDVTITGGSYNINTGVVLFTNNTGGTFSVSGFSSGMTDSYTTGATLSGNVIQFGNNIIGPNYYNVNLLPLLSGKTDVSLFNSHTGNTNNPHQTTFSGLTSTAHTHTISDISGLTTTLNTKYDKSGGTVSGSVTANTFVKSGGTSTQFLKADGSSDSTTYENSANKQNSMVIDGTGIKFPTVDTVNLQANNLLKVASGTGFIDYNDTFNMVLTNPSTITVTGSDPGTFIKSRLFVPPFVPLDAVRNITSRVVLASSISLPSDGRYFKFLGYDYASDSIIASTTGFFLVNDIVALGTVEMLRSGGVNSFISLQMQLDVSTVSLFDLTMSPNQTTSKINPNPNLTTNVSSGLIKSCGISWGQPNPHIKIIPSTGTTPFIRIDPAYLTTSTGYPTTTNVDTTTYWNGSSLVSTGNNNSASIQRWLLHIDGRVFFTSW